MNSKMHNNNFVNLRLKQGPEYSNKTGVFFISLVRRFTHVFPPLIVRFLYNIIKLHSPSL